MGRKRHTPEQIITALREAEVGLARGKSREADQPGARYHRADVLAVEAGVRRDEGEPGARRLKELERENGRLKRAVVDLTLDKLILEESGQGKLLSPERRRRCMVRVRQQLGGVGEESVPGARAATHDPAPGEESGE